MVKGSAKQARLDVIPTSEGDSLILENGSEVPRAGECVLTASAAEALGAKKGDDLVIKVKRLMGSELETGRIGTSHVRNIGRTRQHPEIDFCAPSPVGKILSNSKTARPCPNMVGPGRPLPLTPCTAVYIYCSPTP